MPSIRTTCRILLLQTARLVSSSMLWVVLVTSLIASPQHVSSHGSHHSNPPQRSHHQAGRASPPSSAARQSGAPTHDPTSGFHDSKIVHDTDHINEHLQGKAAVNVSEMSLEELEFHYFKMHDFDNNTKLDGLEILKALTHLLPYDSVDEEEKAKVDTNGKTADEVSKERKEKELSYYTEIVDNVLADDDIDDDGFLTYPEYIIARRREEARELQDEIASKGTSSKVH